MPRHAAIVLLSGALLIGLAQVALLPAWEGFDESAHYSYIQQLAETGTWPRFGDPISADVDDYLKIAPSASSLMAAWSYRNFFAASPQAIETARVAVHFDRDRGRTWRAGGGANWEAQQPPLYYLLMAPTYLVSKGWSLANQLLLLRGLSYVIAWLGLCVAAFSMLAKEQEEFPLRSALILAPALWPALFPMWFPEMARLGNDSLVILLAACAWLIVKKLVASNGGGKQHLALGTVLGLGLLTKATFLPFVVVIFGMLSFRVWQARINALVLRRRLRGLFGCFAVVTVVAGWWYLQIFLETGNAIGSYSVIRMNEAGGLLEGLLQHGSIYTFVRLPWLFESTFLWAGTWSFVRPPFISLIPLVLTTVLLTVGYIWSVKTRSLTLLDWVPPSTIALFLLALCYHSLVLIGGGAPGAPAWYLHSFAPILAPLLGYGLAGTVAVRGWRPFISILMFYPIAFLPLALGIQGLFFAGCGGTNAPNSSFYDISSAASCATHLSVIYDNLSVISFPQMAIILFAGGWVLTTCGVMAAVYCMRSEPPGRHSSGMATRDRESGMAPKTP